MTIPVVQAIADECGDDLYAVDQDCMEQVVGELLHELGMNVCTCESMTGGLIAGRITNIPGASDVFECGLVTYSNRIKHKLAGVAVKTLDEHTAVSLETAAEMAQGALALSGASVAVSITGVAGPDDTPEGEVGTVFVGLAGPLGVRSAKVDMLRSRDRAYNRNLATVKALDALRLYLLEIKRAR